jgi:hypothetical protein
MMKRLGFFAGVFGLAGWVMVSPTMATKEIAQKEKKGCVTCHVKAGAKELNEAGNYYKEHKTLEGFKKKPE